VTRPPRMIRDYFSSPAQPGGGMICGPTGWMAARDTGPVITKRERDDRTGGNLVRGLGVLKVLTVVMGMLILLGTAVVVVTIARRAGSGQSVAPTRFQVVLHEPAGTRIGGIIAVGDRLAVLLQGGGPADRVVLVDPQTGAQVGRVEVAR
jgi:hypothetical protein